MKPNFSPKNPSEMTHPNTDDRSFRKTATLVGYAFVLLVFSAGASFGQNSRLVNTKVEGLPSGLDVSFLAWSPICGNNGMGFSPSGSVHLTESTYTTYEQVTVPSGPVQSGPSLDGPPPNGPTWRAVTHARYEGQLGVLLPANNGCGSLPEDTVRLEYTVFGVDNGQLDVRRASGLARLPAWPPLQFDRTIGAKSVGINVAGAVPPTSLFKGAFHRLFAKYEDSFGFAAVRMPSLELTQIAIAPLSGVITNFSFAKMWITDANEVCLRASATQACRARSLGGSITVGNVTVNVGETTDSGNSDVRSVTWVFRLDAGFKTGTYNLVASADDADFDGYSVDGELEVLNLLPWKSFKLPVDITN